MSHGKRFAELFLSLVAHLPDNKSAPILALEIDGMAHQMDAANALVHLWNLGGELIASPRQARHLLHWFATTGKSPLDERLPWLPFDVIDLLDSFVTQQSQVSEFSGAGSTRWFADRVASVTAAELTRIGGLITVEGVTGVGASFAW